MEQTVAERLYKSFYDVCDCEKLSNAQREKIKNFLDSINWENENDIDYFYNGKTSLEIPILLIEVEQNEANKIDTYQFFRLESRKRREISNIDDIINFETALLMYKLKQNFYIVEIFTKKDTRDIRLIKLINHDHLFLIEIGVDLIMRDLRSLKSMCQNINVNGENSYGKTVFQILHENNRNATVELLLQNECEFPESEIARSIPLIEKRLKSNKEFHQFIKDANLEAIDTFLKVNPKQQYMYNEYNKSACAMAIKMKNFKLFSFLFRRGLTLTGFEMHLLNKNEEFLNYFRTKTFSGIDLRDRLQILESITHTKNKLGDDLNVYEIYDELNKIPSVNLILQILNKIQHLCIDVDYQESKSGIWPYKYDLIDYFVHPIIKRIFVSGGGRAKQLLGTFAFEITHFAMYWLYKNNGKPYYIDDDNSQKRFNEIVQNIRKNVSNGSIQEKIIKSVYDHAEKYWHSELISSVNHILAFYEYDAGRKILQQQTPDLLTFYEIYVKPDLEKHLRRHFNHNYSLFNTDFHKEMEKCNNNFHEINNLSQFISARYSKNVMIKTDCVRFTCLKLFQNITRYKNSPINIENTFFIDLETFSYSTYEIVSELPKCELLILFDRFEQPFLRNKRKIIPQCINEVAKRFIFIFHETQNWSFDNAVTFTDRCKLTDMVRFSEKLIFDTIEVNFQGQKLKLEELNNSEDEIKILPKPISTEILHIHTHLDEHLFSIFSPSYNDVVVNPSKLSTYIKRKFVTTIFELDELRDEIIEKYVCENITDVSKESNFKLKTKNDKLITFPGKTLRIIEDYIPMSKPMEFLSHHIYNEMNNDIFILSLINSSESFIIIDEEKEIRINNVSYSDVETFSKNNNKFNIHWFVQSNASQYFYHHLKTFGSFDKTRSFYYREKTTIDEENLFKKLQHQKVFLIAAPAGMGKTETIRNMPQYFVENDSLIWAPVVYLRQCTEILRTYCPQNPDPDYLFDFLTELLGFKRIFEKEKFKIWCKRKANNVCLFLDGADENGPEFTDITIKLIKRLSQTYIKYIIVSVRLNGKFEFEYKLKTVAIEMEPLSYDEKIKCLINTWPEKPKITNIIEIGRRVAKHFRDIDSFLNNSLQIVLVTKICEDQLKNFSKNLINVYFYFKDELSLIEMYKKFIETKVTEAIDRYKIGEVNTQSQLQFVAIKELLNTYEMQIFLTPDEIKLHKNFVGDIKNWQDLEGIIDGIFSKKLNFVHRTYTEYFFTDFLLNLNKHYKAWNTEREQFFFEQILVCKEFEYVRKFLNSYKGSSDLLLRQPTYFQIPTTLHAAVVQNIEDNNTEILHYLYSLGFNITINPSSLITKYINNNSPNSISKLIETIKYLVKECDNVHLSIDELRKIKQILDRILFEDRIELIKALLQCKLTDLDGKELQKDHQTEPFLSLWNKAKALKAEVKADHKNKEPEKLLPLFNDILQMINIFNFTTNS